MINLVKADIYRSFHNAFLYGFWGILIFISILPAILNALLGLQISLPDLLSLSLVILTFPLGLWPVVFGHVIGMEFKTNTVANTLAFGVSPAKFFLSKVIVAAALVIITVLIMVVPLVSSAFLLCTPHRINNSFYTNYLLTILAAVPLYIAAAVFGTLLTFHLKKISYSLYAYLLLIQFVDLITLVLCRFNPQNVPVFSLFIAANLSSLRQVHSLHIKTSQVDLELLAGGIVSHTQMLDVAAIGLVYILVFTMLGIVTSRRLLKK